MRVEGFEWRHCVSCHEAAGLAAVGDQIVCAGCGDFQDMLTQVAQGRSTHGVLTDAEEEALRVALREVH